MYTILLMQLLIHRVSIRDLNFVLEGMTRQVNRAIEQAERNLGIE